MSASKIKEKIQDIKKEESASHPLSSSAEREDSESDLDGSKEEIQERSFPPRCMCLFFETMVKLF